MDGTSRTTLRSKSIMTIFSYDAVACRTFEMTIASDLLQRHIQTLVDDNAQWQTLITDDILWEFAYAPALGHPAEAFRPSGGDAPRKLVPQRSGKLSLYRSQGVSLC